MIMVWNNWCHSLLEKKKQNKQNKTKKKHTKTLELLLTSLPSQFQDIHSPDKLNDRDCCLNFESCHSPNKEISEKGVFISEMRGKMLLNL